MGLCEMNPIVARTGMGSSRTSWPATLTLPALGVSSVASTRSVVVLPAPLGPKMLRKPPRSTLKEMPFRTSRRPNVLRRPSTTISGAAAPAGVLCGSGTCRPPSGRGAVRPGAAPLVQSRGARLLLLRAALGPQRHEGADAQQDGSDPDPADEREHDDAQGDRLRG